MQNDLLNKKKHFRSIMSKQQYFSSYKSPNICVVPNSSTSYQSPPKRLKLEIPVRDNSPQNLDINFLDDFDIDEIIECLNDCDENAQNTERQTDIVNNSNKTLYKDCPKSFFKITNDNEGNDLNYSYSEKDVTIKSIDNEEKHFLIKQNINTYTASIQKKSNVCSEHIDNDFSEMFVPSEITQQPNKKTEKNNILIQDKSLLQTELHSVSTNTASKPFNGDEIKETIDELKCYAKENLEYSGQLQDKHNATEIIKIERKIDKQLPCEYKDVIIPIDISQTVNTNKNKVKTQKEIDKKEVVLPQNVNNKSTTDKFLSSNLENKMFQCLQKKYSLFSLIHSGKFSKIFKCKDSDGKHYAVKILKKPGSDYGKKDILNKIQCDIPKENLLCIFLIAGFKLNNNWCYLTDFYPKNLKDVLKESKMNLHIDTIQLLAGQLIGAVTTIRNKNIVHSDINPSHILLDYTNRKLKVCGFDEAYYIEAANLFPYKGTKCYRAPEVILGYSAGFSLDVWSTALVLHEMATGIQLFGGCIGEHVLYKQMCLLGDVPPQMLLRSRYRNKYIIGLCLQDRCLRHKNYRLLKGKNKIACTIQGAYYSHWTAGKNQKQISKDMQKIRQFIKLLEQMLVIYPEHRLPIEFAYSNPFIYNVSQS